MERDREALITVYGEICRAHDGIADFRAKLLAFLPFASGTGIFILLGGAEASSNEHLPAIGLFGALVTFGLFIYEMRGIQRCNSLSNCGRNLEYELLGKENHTGTFVGEPKSAFYFIGNTWASIITYSIVIAAWSYVALVGLGFENALILSAISLAIIVAGGNCVRIRQNRMLEEQITSAKRRASQEQPSG